MDSYFIIRHWLQCQTLKLEKKWQNPKIWFVNNFGRDIHRNIYQLVGEYDVYFQWIWAWLFYAHVLPRYRKRKERYKLPSFEVSQMLQQLCPRSSAGLYRVNLYWTWYIGWERNRLKTDIPYDPKRERKKFKLKEKINKWLETGDMINTYLSTNFSINSPGGFWENIFYGGTTDNDSNLLCE